MVSATVISGSAPTWNYWDSSEKEREIRLLAWRIAAHHTARMKSRTSEIHDRSASEPALCSHPGCTEIGAYKAPVSPDNLESYRWFCLEHVREYNAAWNFHRGMDDDAMEQEIREDAVWRRPTWPLGTRPGTGRTDRLHDPLDVLGRNGEIDGETLRQGEAQLKSMTGAERKALATLGLEAPVSRMDVKLRYKTLAKTLHPDANGGDKRAEERLKSVNHAYTTLRDSDRLS